MAVSSNIDDYFVGVIEIINEEVRNTLAYLCEQAVRRIRDRSSEESWMDDTGNLRSSIGYSIYEYGQKVMESTFPVVRDGSEGAQRGREYAEDLAGLFATTYAAVVVAAMEYAEFVEARKNKDVLASTHEWAKEKFEGYMQRTVAKAQLRIDAYGDNFKLKLKI
jgi:hypothetical protein